MAYVAAPPPAPVLPPVTFVQSSAKYWQDLQKHVASGGREGNKGQKMNVRMGNGDVVLLPVFNRAHFMGQDEADDLSNLFGVEEGNDQGSILAGGSAPTFSVPDNLEVLSQAPTASSLESAPTLAAANQALTNLAGGSAPTFSVPDNLEVLSQAPTASSLESAPTLAAANQALTNAQGTGNQSAINAALAAVKAATQATGSILTQPSTAAASGSLSSQIVPGVSNTILLFGGAILLIVLASGKKR